MQRILAIGLLVISGTVFADEYYEFFRIRCTPAFSEIEIQRSGFWNAKMLVWPGNRRWSEHVAALKWLEKDGLYVLEDGYGHYEGPEHRFSCGNNVLIIRVDMAVNDSCINDPKEPCPETYRTNPRFEALHNGKVVAQLPLNGGPRLNRFRIYSEYGEARYAGHAYYIEVCAAGNCEDVDASIVTQDTIIKQFSERKGKQAR